MAPAKRSTESNRLRLLLGLVIVLAGLVLWDWQSGGTTHRTPEHGGRSPARRAPGETLAARATNEVQAVNPLTNLGLDKLHDTIRRPLFEKTRRPVEQPVRAPAMPAAAVVVPKRLPDQNALSLLGILVSEGRTIALLKKNQSGQNVRVEEGDTVDGWTIERIEAQRVVLKQGDTRIALQLFRKR